MLASIIKCLFCAHKKKKKKNSSSIYINFIPRVDVVNKLYAPVCRSQLPRHSKNGIFSPPDSYTRNKIWKKSTDDKDFSSLQKQARNQRINFIFEFRKILLKTISFSAEAQASRKLVKNEIYRTCFCLAFERTIRHVIHSTFSLTEFDNNLNLCSVN